MKIVVTDFPSKKGGKQADVELQFTDDDVLAGLALKGFVVWKNQQTLGELAVALPSHMWMFKSKLYSRPVVDDWDTDDSFDNVEALKQMILEEYRAWLQREGKADE